MLEAEAPVSPVPNRHVLDQARLMIAAFFVAQGVVFATVLLALLRVMTNQSRAHARREDLLLNQLLHAVGKPWQEAPAEHRAPVQPDPNEGRFTLDPETL